MTLFEETLAALNNHRANSVVTCEESCFCWEIDRILLKAELGEVFPEHVCGLQGFGPNDTCEACQKRAIA